jgi:hypothetical protein
MSEENNASADVMKDLEAFVKPKRKGNKKGGHA